MNTRSSKNWQSKAGTWDSLNTEYVDFDGRFPKVSNKATQIDNNAVVCCHDYKKITQNCLISMFVDDYILERFWNNPLKYVNYYQKAGYIMSPDFSLLLGMPEPMLMWNVYRNRLIGHIWQKAGLQILPTVSWADPDSFNYCFEGIEEGSSVAISNVGCRTVEQKEYFDAGLRELQQRINPNLIVFQCSKALRTEYQNSIKNVLFLNSYWATQRENRKELV